MPRGVSKLFAENTPLIPPQNFVEVHRWKPRGNACRVFWLGYKVNAAARVEAAIGSFFFKTPRYWTEEEFKTRGAWHPARFIFVNEAELPHFERGMKELERVYTQGGEAEECDMPLHFYELGRQNINHKQHIFQFRVDALKERATGIIMGYRYHITHATERPLLSEHPDPLVRRPVLAWTFDECPQVFRAARKLVKELKGRIETSAALRDLGPDKVQEMIGRLPANKVLPSPEEREPIDEGEA